MFELSIYAIQVPAREFLDGVWYEGWLTWAVVTREPAGDLPSIGWRWIPLTW